MLLPQNIVGLDAVAVHLGDGNGNFVVEAEPHMINNASLGEFNATLGIDPSEALRWAISLGYLAHCLEGRLFLFFHASTLRQSVCSFG